MKYYRPDIQLASALPDQTDAVEKLGGLPWGLPPSLWPFCSSCKKPQTLLAELHHAPPRLDLFAEGRVLMAFHCNNDPGMCDDWAQDSGGNAALVLDGTQLGTGLTHPPLPTTPAYPEAHVLSWVELDDGVSVSLRESFYSDELYMELDETIIRSVTMGTRLGGVPAWIQSPSEGPSGYRFIGQLDSTYSFYRPMPPPNQRTAIQSGVDPEGYEGRVWYAEGPNFGDGGIAYLYVRDREPGPHAKLFWQCG